jgi:glycosyltransferase involved in cell wall biosynthesis
MSRRPARILFLNSRSEFGGADMGLHSIVRYLDPARFQSIVLLPHAGPLVAPLQAAGAEVLYHDICRLERLATPAQISAFARGFVQSLAYLRQTIQERQIDLVYTNSSAIPVGALAARRAGIPNVWHVREIWTSPRWLTRPLYRYIRAYADRIIAISQAVAQGDFGRLVPKISIIRDGVDTARFQNLDAPAAAIRAELGLSPDARLVVSMARLTPQKGMHVFIEAAHLALQAGADAYFAIAGDIPRPMYQPYKARLRQMIADFGLEQRVSLIGWRADGPALLRAADVFVLASAGPEGAGLVIPEAWLAGAPVIVPDHSGPREIVEDGRTGLWFRNADAGDLSAKLCALLVDSARRRALASAGRQVALTYHDARVNTAAIADLLDDLLARRAR